MLRIKRILFTGFFLWVFSHIGWIQINGDLLVEDPFWNKIIVLGILSLLAGIIMFAGTISYSFFVLLTVGLGIFLLPIYLGGIGYLFFWGTQQLLPGWVIINTGPLGVIVMSFAIGCTYIRINKTETDDEHTFHM